MQDEKTGGTDDEKTGGDDGGGGGAADPLSRKAFLNELAGAQATTATPEEGELSPDQQREIRAITQERIAEIQADFEDMYPEATKSQMQEYVRAAFDDDHGKMMSICKEAEKVTREKEDQERRENSDDLHVQRGGSGKNDKTEAPKSMGESIVNAGNLFNRA